MHFCTLCVPLVLPGQHSLLPHPHILPPLSPPSPPLRTLSCAEDLCSLVLKGDGCRLVLSAMRRHKTVPVQHAGLSSLCNMAISGETGKQRRPAQSASLHFTQVHPCIARAAWLSAWLCLSSLLAPVQRATAKGCAMWVWFKA